MYNIKTTFYNYVNENLKNKDNVTAYHGTSSLFPFTEFRPTMIGKGVVSYGNKYGGFFFTTEEENAEYYAEYFVATVNIPESELIESSDKHPSSVLKIAEKENKIYIIKDVLDGVVFSDIIVVPINKLSEVDIISWEFVGDEEMLFENYDNIFGNGVDSDDQISKSDIIDVLEMLMVDVKYIMKIPIFKKYYNSKI